MLRCSTLAMLWLPLSRTLLQQNSTTISIDWEEERQDANSLLRSLYEEHSEDEMHRRWLLTRWPEWPSDELADTLPDPERYIPEWYLRDGEDDLSLSFKSIKTCINQSFGLLQRVTDEGGQLEVAEGIGRLSDEGLKEAVPLLLPKLQRKTLQFILSTLSGRERQARDRRFLLDKINHEWRSFVGKAEGDHSQEILEKILAVFKKPKSFLKVVPSRQILLNASSPWTAAKSAFNQLDRLPLQCLHVMLEALLGKMPEVKVGKLPKSGTKDRIITALWEKGTELLAYDQAGEALPEELRKSLVVMSVSARYALGGDDNLMDFLGPLPIETKVLQVTLLSALSDLKKLNYDDLRLVYSELIGAPSTHERRHPTYLRQPIRRVLLDCLLRSEVRSVPEKVIQAASKISALCSQQPAETTQTKLQSKMNAASKISALARQRQAEDWQTKLLSMVNFTHEDDMQMGMEVEAMLRVSSHLQQIMLNWNEVSSQRPAKDDEVQRFILQPCVVDSQTVGPCLETFAGDGGLPRRVSDPGSGVISRDTRQSGKEELVLLLTDGTDGDDGGKTTQLLGNITDKNTQREDLPVGFPEGWTAALTATTEMPKRRLPNCEDKHSSLAEAMEIQHLTRVADEAAEVAYTIIGCAMEKTARLHGISLRRPVRKYLRCGMRKVPADPGVLVNSEQDQLSVILSIAEKIPTISPRVMDNVRRRLGL